MAIAYPFTNEWYEGDKVAKGFGPHPPCPGVPWLSQARHCNVAADPLSLSLRPQLCLLLREADNCNVVGTPLGVVLCSSAIISLM
ncbi:hypothetical protein J1N35_027121 [Gossypium stocksii]|uniref:Uncharacterized protein n=1 Tax=Gossypium stocksii TaxID=47602 RepID=A0A9D3ZZW4_9ROSI|nr:hypothetical protein J1N35_027121 [Gossypium stocksii]